MPRNSGESSRTSTDRRGTWFRLPHLMPRASPFARCTLIEGRRPRRGGVVSAAWEKSVLLECLAVAKAPGTVLADESASLVNGEARCRE